MVTDEMQEGSGHFAAASASPRQPELKGAVGAEFKILLARSMFSAGPVASKSEENSESSAPAANAFALKGLSQEDHQFTGFVEDAASPGRIVQVHVGDTLGKGQVRDLSLHEMAYEIDGKVFRVELGQGLDGVPSTTARVDSAAKSTHARRHASAGGDVRASTLDENH